MDNLFGIYIFTHNVFIDGKLISYEVSGDTRDFIARRSENIEVDEELYPVWFSYGKINNRIVPCYIKNINLYNQILEKLLLELSMRRIIWNSHFSFKKG